MERQALKYLADWKERSDRRPLIIRGARQVGKSYLTRMFGEQYFDNIIEINFEDSPEIIEVFIKNKPQDTISLLETMLQQEIIPGKTLLFLDEIQTGPKILARLRYFYEQMPELHIIAAGSLLDFVLADHDFSMPVGRIEYLHLGPMTFEEFLLATGNQIKLEHLHNFSFGKKWLKPMHDLFMEDFRKFCIIGGMPAAVSTYVETGSYLNVERMQEVILTAYKDDFNKYGKHINPVFMQKSFSRIPLFVGQKFKYVKIDHENSRIVSEAVELLEMAKTIKKICHTHANGIPLEAEVKNKHFKVIFLDVGLMCRACKTDIIEILDASDLLLINSGAICEQFTGQHLLHNQQFFHEPELYCWMRQKNGTSSEVDYVIQQGSNIIPVEVKAGTTGSLKSLQVFVAQKGTELALRFNSDMPSIVEAESNIKDHEKRKYRLLSLPFYMIGQAKRILKEVQ